MKIAVCVSGETRTFEDSFLDGIREWFGPNFDIDFYGHTWKHCSLANIKQQRFTNLVIEDQKVIDDWVSEDFWHRFPYKNKSETFKQKMNLLSSDLDREYISNIIRAVYGQTWGAFECFNLVQSSYDLYLRWRWDLEVMDPANLRKCFVKTSEIYNLKSVSTPVQLTSHLRLKSNKNYLFPDLFWIMNPKCFQKWQDHAQRFRSLYDNINFTRNAREFPSSHSLWQIMAPSTEIYGVFNEHDILIRWENNERTEFSKVNMI